MPAAKNGAFPDNIEHFHRWLIDNEFDYPPSAFVPRKIFGQYLNHVLDDALKSKPDSAVNLINSEAVAIDIDKNAASVNSVIRRNG